MTLLAIENYLLVVEEIKRCGYITASYKARLLIGLFKRIVGENQGINSTIYFSKCCFEFAVSYNIHVYIYL